METPLICKFIIFDQSKLNAFTNSFFSTTSDDFLNSYRPSKLCSDLAFWKEKCVNDSRNADTYVESRRCSTYENQSHQFESCKENEIYCPNKDKCFSDVNKCKDHFYFGNETQCQSQNMHHCAKSNQCIWKDWVCDGFVQCLEGDDEDFDLCYERGSFAEGATVKCHEIQRYGYNVTILATKCNGIVECKDGTDELDCQNDDSLGFTAFGILFAIVAAIWITIYRTLSYDEFGVDSVTQESRYDLNLSDSKGEKLSTLKVSFKKCL